MIKHILLGLLGLTLVTSTMAADKGTNYTVTAYCSCKKCCGKWYVPEGKQKTASGAKPTEGVTIAASRKIPFGTKLNIEGVGVRTVQDRLAPRFDNRIDVYFADHERARKFGKKTLLVKRTS